MWLLPGPSRQPIFEAVVEIEQKLKAMTHEVVDMIDDFKRPVDVPASDRFSH